MVREDQLKRFITHNQLQMNDSTEMVIDQLKQNLKEDFGIEVIVAVSNRVNWLVGKNTMNFDELFAVVCNDVMNDEEQKKVSCVIRSRHQLRLCSSAAEI
ncbi:unnamed protein product [Anisakis simplex]|uniref:ATP-binding protein n=1 Tax=Anisakis simplex TaxID=6269 RepID=A0A0M3JPD0_ANISI|nr:unnamed protein product [Anisakis simplex]